MRFKCVCVDYCSHCALSANRTHSVMLSTAVLQQLEKQNHAVPKLSGRLLTRRHGDVEVLACLSKPFPTNSTGFQTLCMGREWVKMDVVILSVGPAGFASVPYVANSKGNREVKTESVYTNTEKGTLFHSFLKGKTNKDRGERVSEHEGQCVSAILESGFAMSWFMNKENFDDKTDSVVEFESPEQREDVLPAGKIVVLQVASANVEQAVGGKLLKVRRLLSIASDSMYSVYFREQFPTSLQAYDDCYNKAKKINSIQSIMQSNVFKYHLVVVSKKAYMVRDMADSASCFVLCGALEDGGEIRVLEKQILDATGACDPERAMKLANMAIACGAVSILNQNGVDFNNGGECNNGLQFMLDIDKMLKYSTVSSILQSSAESTNTPICFGDEWLVVESKQKEQIMWSSKKDIYYCDKGDKIIAFMLDLKKKELQHPWSERSNASVSRICDGMPGLFYHIRCLLLPASVSTSAKECSAYIENSDMQEDLFIRFQVKEDCYGSGSVRKRRREEMLSSTDPKDRM